MVDRVNGFERAHVARGLKWAREYEKRGLSVLPTRADDKRPLLPTFAEYWGGGAPPVDQLWRRWPSGSLQIITGPRVVVLDLDGRPGIERFEQWCRERNYRLPRTWVSSSDRREGKHIWFSRPRGLGDRVIPTLRPLWGVWDPKIADRHGKVIGGWKRRSSVELLADRALVVAPPSIHPKTGLTYCWHKGSSPVEVPFPAPLPLWVLGIEPSKRPEAPARSDRTTVPSVRPVRRLVRGSLDLPCAPRAVIAAIPDITGLVRDEWGLGVVDGRPNLRGYVKCHDFGRVDNHPSAGFRPRDGRFWRPGMGSESFCLFRLGVEMGRYGSWREACVDLGRRYLPHLFRSESDASQGQGVGRV